MSLEDILANYKPTENREDDGFEILKGTYKTTPSLKQSETKDKRPCYKLELTVNDVLEGNGATGRRFWRTYMKQEDESVKKLMNDLFTAGIILPMTSVFDFETSFFLVNNFDITVRAWGWTPTTNRDGSPIPKEEQSPMQQFKIVNATKIKVKPKQPSDVPF